MPLCAYKCHEEAAAKHPQSAFQLSCDHGLCEACFLVSLTADNESGSRPHIPCPRCSALTDLAWIHERLLEAKIETRRHLAERLKAAQKLLKKQEEHMALTKAQAQQMADEILRLAHLAINKLRARVDEQCASAIEPYRRSYDELRRLADEWTTFGEHLQPMTPVPAAALSSALCVDPNASPSVAPVSLQLSLFRDIIDIKQRVEDCEHLRWKEQPGTTRRSRSDLSQPEHRKNQLLVGHLEPDCILPVIRSLHQLNQEEPLAFARVWQAPDYYSDRFETLHEDLRVSSLSAILAKFPTALINETVSYLADMNGRQSRYHRVPCRAPVKNICHAGDVFITSGFSHRLYIWDSQKLTLKGVVRLRDEVTCTDDLTSMVFGADDTSGILDDECDDESEWYEEYRYELRNVRRQVPVQEMCHLGDGAVAVSLMSYWPIRIVDTTKGLFQAEVAALRDDSSESVGDYGHRLLVLRDGRFINYTVSGHKHSNLHTINVWKRRSQAWADGTDLELVIPVEHAQYSVLELADSKLLVHANGSFVVRSLESGAALQQLQCPAAAVVSRMLAVEGGQRFMVLSNGEKTAQILCLVNGQLQVQQTFQSNVPYLCHGGGLLAFGEASEEKQPGEVKVYRYSISSIDGSGIENISEPVVTIQRERYAKKDWGFFDNHRLVLCRSSFFGTVSLEEWT